MMGVFIGDDEADLLMLVTAFGTRLTGSVGKTAAADRVA
jgi:hypothetical protein